jgi:hypothetical protein
MAMVMVVDGDESGEMLKRSWGKSKWYEMVASISILRYGKQKHLEGFRYAQKC